MIKAPFVDHTGKRSWTVTAVVLWLVIAVVFLALWWFAPDWIAERVVESSTYVRDSFFAIVVAYVVRRHTQAKHETNGTPPTQSHLEDE